MDERGPEPRGRPGVVAAAVVPSRPALGASRADSLPRRPIRVKGSPVSPVHGNPDQIQILRGEQSPPYGPDLRPTMPGRFGPSGMTGLTPSFTLASVLV